MLLHKYSTIVQYIPIILSTIILVIVQQYKTVHPFWDKQPVMRIPPYAIRGTIGNNPKFHIKLKIKSNNINILHEFRHWHEIRL